MACCHACPQGCKVCIIGHPKSFFTLYKAVLDSGAGRVCHFDRDGRLLSGGASGEQLDAAVQQACGGASCLLVAAELVQRGGFPLAAFQQVVVYASEQEGQALRARLAEVACPLHFLEVELPAQQAQHGAAAGPPQQRVVPGGEPGGQRQAAQGAAAGGAGAVACVQHACRPAAPAVAVVAAQQVAAASCPDWPVIISSDPCRPIRCMGKACCSQWAANGKELGPPPGPCFGSSHAAPLGTHDSCRSRRVLYEAVLGVERLGGSVVERRLSLVDLVLSPSAGLVICDNTASKLVRWDARWIP